MYLWCNTVPFIVIDWIAVLVLLLPEAFLTVISMPLKLCGNKGIMDRFHSISKINFVSTFHYAIDYRPSKCHDRNSK